MISANRDNQSTVQDEASTTGPPITILHIIGLAYGGAGQHILSLATACNSRRFESAVAMAEDSPMRPQFERSGVRVLPLKLEHYGGLTKNIVAFRQLADILRRERFDVIETHTSVAAALGRVAARMFTRTPLVHMLHTFAAHPYRSALSRKAGVFIERRLDRWTDWYIAGSQAMIDRGVADRIFTRDKVVLISNGIDLAPFDRDDISAPSVDNGTPRAGVTVGFLGRLEQQKGVAYLIRAAAIVRHHNPHVRFVIAGDGTLRAELEQLAQQLQVADVVRFVGWKADVVGFLRQIDVLAMPSLWEAFGLSAAEAMAAGKPVVASRIEGLPEVVDEGHTGILVPPGDCESLARAIVELAADPARRRVLGRRGRARVEERFSLDRMIVQHKAFFERIAGKKPGDLVEMPLARRTNDVALAMTD